MQGTQFNEYDCIRLAKTIPAETIPIGTVGVVLMVLSIVPAGYEVEFVEENGRNLGSEPTFTLSEDFLTPLKKSSNGT
jgi:hypothetical protein